MVYSSEISISWTFLHNHVVSLKFEIIFFSARLELRWENSRKGTSSKTVSFAVSSDIRRVVAIQEDKFYYNLNDSSVTGNYDFHFIIYFFELQQILSSLPCRIEDRSQDFGSFLKTSSNAVSIFIQASTQLAAKLPPGSAPFESENWSVPADDRLRSLGSTFRAVRGGHAIFLNCSEIFSSHSNANHIVFCPTLLLEFVHFSEGDLRKGVFSAHKLEQKKNHCRLDEKNMFIKYSVMSSSMPFLSTSILTSLSKQTIQNRTGTWREVSSFSHVFAMSIYWMMGRTSSPSKQANPVVNMQNCTTTKSTWNAWIPFLKNVTIPAIHLR